MLTEIFYAADNFCKTLPEDFDFRLSTKDSKSRRRNGRLSLSEMLTILILFQSSNYRNFKSYYLLHVSQYMKKDFPNLISYSRFTYLIPRTVYALTSMMINHQGKPTGVTFVDSTSIAVCHNKRIKRNKVFSGLAEKGKTTMDWFFGFKLHLMINDKGEIVSFWSCPVNTGHSMHLVEVA